MMTNHGMKSSVLPRLKYVNGWLLVVMGVSLPLTPAQAHQVYAQLQELEVSHG